MISYLVFKICISFLLLCYIYMVEGSYEDPKNEFLSYAVTNPTIRQKFASRSYSHSSQIFSEEQLTVEFDAFNKNFVIDLEVNKDLFSPKYEETYQENDEEMVYKPLKEKERRCYYKGRMPNVDNSWAAVSTCNGISGVVFDGTETYYIEPYRNSLSEEHLVFKASESKKKNLRCGADLLDLPSMHDVHSDIAHATGAVDSEIDYATKYIEIIIINDNSMYKKYGSNLTAVNDRAKQIANTANALYSPLNIVITVLKLKAWSNEDQITISKDYVQTLKNFLTYRENELLPNEPHDNALLLTNAEFISGSGKKRITGAAFSFGMCHKHNSGVEIADFSSVIGQVGSTYSHELGHNLGMKHDDQLHNCQCPKKHCIMFSQAPADPKTHWSSCSREALETAFAQGKYKCLENMPEDVNLF